MSPASTSPVAPVLVGPVGRLGAWAGSHFRTVLIAWIVIVVGLGFFAPKVETALSGAGWEASGSESLAARQQLDQQFGGLSSSALQVVVSSNTLSPATPRSTPSSPRPATCSPAISASPA